MPNSLLSPRLWYKLLAVLACALFLATPARADPPGRIGRIAWLSDSASGAVSLYNPDTGESYSAPLNHPLTSGDVLTTGPNSQAEIQIGSMTVRLDSDTTLDFSRIDDEQVRLYLSEGRVIAKLPSRDVVREFELSTLNGRFNANDAGIYRFDADANSSSATAYYGSLHFESNDNTLEIRAGQSAQFWQTGQSGDQTRYRLSTAINDNFTQWSAARDRRPVSTAYSRYVSPEMTGAEDLDAYGSWSQNTEYGAIWYPRAVAPDWAPYRNGHWAWVAPWGWSWVAYEPWGFAPFHYGRWVHHRGAWGWVPGVRVARPAYSPAMVAWIGSPGIGISIAIGTTPTVGWFPLAPHEVYVPAYRSSPKYVRHINVTHVTHINNVTEIVNRPQHVVQKTRYAHREQPRAVTFVPADVVTHRRPVQSAALSPRDHRALRKQPLQAAAPIPTPAAPRVESRSSHRYQDRPGQLSAREERERKAPVVASPVAPEMRDAHPRRQASAPPSSEVTPRRSERTSPENLRQTPMAGSGSFEPRIQERPVRREESANRQAQREPRPEATPRVAPQENVRTVPEDARTEPQSGPGSFEPRTQQRAARRDEPAMHQPQRESRIEAAPRVAPPENARTVAENTRTAPRSRPEPFESRVQERPIRREEPAMRSPQRESRTEAGQQQVRQAPPMRVETSMPVVREPRHEAPPAAASQASRPAEIRATTNPQPRQESRRPGQDGQDKQRHRRDDAEKRSSHHSRLINAVLSPLPWSELPA